MPRLVDVPSSRLQCPRRRAMSATLRSREEAVRALRAELRSVDNPVGAARALRAVAARFRPEHATSWEAFRLAAERELRPLLNGSAKAMAWAVLDADFGHLADETRSQIRDEPSLAFDMPAAVCAADAGAVEPPGFIVADLVLSGETGFLVGDGGCFKTTTALHLAGAVAGGYPAFGQFPTCQTPVLYVSEEDGVEVLNNRLHALVRGHGWDSERVLPRVHFLALKGCLLEDEAWQEHLASELRRIRAGLLILDPYSGLTLAMENSNDEAKPVVRFWRTLNRDGITVIILHHIGKPHEGRRGIDRLRGASALNQAARFVYLLKRVNLGISLRCLKLSRAEPPSRFVVEPEIESEGGKPTVWRSARLRYRTEKEAEGDNAEAFVIEQLEQHGSLTTSRLKELAKGTGISAVAVSGTIKRLDQRNRIAYEPGSRNSKHWHVVTLPKDSRQAGQGTLPTLPAPCPARSEQGAGPCPPLYEEAGSAGALGAARQAGTHPSEGEPNIRTKLVVGSDATPEERGVANICPGCGGGMGEHEESCGSCRYAAHERAGMAAF